MEEGSIVLTAILQVDGNIKKRSAIVLRGVPRYRDLLVCVVSTQPRQQVKGFDEIISRTDADYATSGLLSDSLIRLGFCLLFRVRMREWEELRKGLSQTREGEKGFKELLTK